MPEEVEYILFHSDGERSLKLDYPELSSIEDFKDLSATELRLCWMIGNASSPLSKFTKKQKVKKAIEIVYPKHKIESDSKLKAFYEYKNGDKDIPFKILKGIARMLLFNPENRTRAKLLSQGIFDSMQDLVVVDSDTMKTMDMDEKKKYAELMIKVNSELPKMIETLESGFGVKLISRKTGTEVKIDINKLDS